MLARSSAMVRNMSSLLGERRPSPMHTGTGRKDYTRGPDGPSSEVTMTFHNAQAAPDLVYSSAEIGSPTAVAAGPSRPNPGECRCPEAYTECTSSDRTSLMPLTVGRASGRHALAHPLQ